MCLDAPNFIWRLNELKVIFYVDGLSVYKSKLPICSGRGTPIVSQSPQRLHHVPGAIFIGAEQSKETEKETGGSSPEARDIEVGGEKLMVHAHVGLRC